MIVHAIQGEGFSQITVADDHCLRPSEKIKFHRFKAVNSHLFTNKNFYVVIFH